jgi:hypothetical protein
MSSSARASRRRRSAQERPPRCRPHAPADESTTSGPGTPARSSARPSEIYTVYRAVTTAPKCPLSLYGLRISRWVSTILIRSSVARIRKAKWCQAMASAAKDRVPPNLLPQVRVRNDRNVRGHVFPPGPRPLAGHSQAPVGLGVDVNGRVRASRRPQRSGRRGSPPRSADPGSRPCCSPGLPPAAKLRPG